MHIFYALFLKRKPKGDTIAATFTFNTVMDVHNCSRGLILGKPCHFALRTPLCYINPESCLVRCFDMTGHIFTGHSATCGSRLSLHVSICLPPPIFCLYLTD